MSVHGACRGLCPEGTCLASQVWMTPTSTGEVLPWLTSTGTVKWTSSTATGMAPTASTCR